jgi:hypothetical protein
MCCAIMHECQRLTQQHKDLSGRLETTHAHYISQQLAAIPNLALNHIHAQLPKGACPCARKPTWSRAPHGTHPKHVSDLRLSLRTSSVGPHLLATSSLSVKHDETVRLATGCDQHVTACCNMLGRQSTTIWRTTLLTAATRFQLCGKHAATGSTHMTCMAVMELHSGGSVPESAVPLSCLQ